MGVLVGTLQAQTPTDEKIRLMSEALAARDVGDLERARDTLQQLIELSPNDPSLQRLLENIELNLQQPAPAEMAEASGGVDLAAMSSEEASRVNKAVEEATARREAAAHAEAAGEHAVAAALLSEAATLVDGVDETERLQQDIRSDQTELYHVWAQQQLRDGDLEGAKVSLERYLEVADETRRTNNVAEKIKEDILSPRRIPIEEVSPEFPADQARIKNLVRMGRAQYLNGDVLGAEQTFREVETLDVYNAEAKSMLTRIADEKRTRVHLDREKTKTQMLEEIGSAWQRPQIYVERPPAEAEPDALGPIEQKLNSIIIPSVNFDGLEFTRAINTLSAISREYDPDGQGVNIVPRDREGIAGQVHINVTDLSLGRILDLIVDDAKFNYQVEEGVIIVREGARRPDNLETENFPVSPATINRLMAGSSGATADASSSPTSSGSGFSAQSGDAMMADDPFAAPSAQSSVAAPTAAPSGRESLQLRQFLQQAAGVDFNVTGSNLLYDGSDIWVTQTPRNLERIRNVFRRLTDVRQVEIESRFLEVSEGAVDELGFNWQLQSPGGDMFQTSNRTLAGAFAGSQISNATVITGPGVPNGSLSIPTTPPAVPGGASLGGGASNLAVLNRSANGYDISATIRMLQQKTGADLLSAPKVTVISGYQASINVAQEIRYPDSYGDTQSDVGRSSGGSGGGGSAGVTITPGTPQDFQMRRVGVELTVTPTVEQDNSVTLDLNPRVTEFQGFVEFGGTSLAISGGQTVSVPSGFYQPIFATREVTTRVNVWDGATVVMGGLTREEVRTVSDRTPILGDIPLLGRFFRSEGEGSQKRNLLIFVTANLVSPGGSPLRQKLRTVEPGALYQNPTIVMPSGAVSREKKVQ